MIVIIIGGIIGIQRQKQANQIAGTSTNQVESHYSQKNFFRPIKH